MRSLPLFAVVALAGCTQSPQAYPSLLPRPIETQSFAEPVRAAPVVAPDPALDARISEITATLDAGNKRFASAAQDAEAKIAVARGVAEGSDAWLNAQTALSTLQSLRAPTIGALAELERMATERGVAGQPPYPALTAAVAAADAMAAAQDDRIGALEAALAGA